jgi:acyl-phosphate glycerol 3-phosphate acyltransferase
MWFLVPICCALGYLFGSFPAGYFAGRLAGIDVRTTGSGNIGATNVLRVLGKRWGYPVFVIDAFKGFAAVRLAYFLVNYWPAAKPHADYIAILAGIASIVGHTFPVWLGFKGGKGVATTAGVMIGLLPLAVPFVMLLWLSVFYATRYVSLASIVAAVEEGRLVYDNLQKFIRIQVANLFMFILAFIGSSAFAIAGTALLSPAQVLWIHMAIVAPIGAVMGLDLATPGIMDRKPRPFNQPILVRSMMVRLFIVGLFMAAATLILVQIGKTTYGSLEVGQTMAVVGLGLMNIFVALNLRYPTESAFGPATVSNPKLLWAFAWAVLGSMLITQMKVMQDLFLEWLPFEKKTFKKFRKDK